MKPKASQNVMDAAREMLDQLINARRCSYSEISRLLGHNASYIQQYLKKGSPGQSLWMNGLVLGAGL